MNQDLQILTRSLGLSQDVTSRPECIWTIYGYITLNFLLTHWLKITMSLHILPVSIWLYHYCVRYVKVSAHVS